MNKRATFFEFTSYKFEPAKKRILFDYKTEFSAEGGSASGGKNSKTIFFTETIILPKIPVVTDKKIISKLLKGLHIILGISYYKLYYPKKIKLNYDLSKKEADFWNVVYQKGLGEFFYKNKLDPKISPQFSFSKENSQINADSPAKVFAESKNLGGQAQINADARKNNKRCLVGIGGGKDSIVTGELLKKGGFDVTGLTVETNNQSKLIDKVIKILAIKDLKVKRILDPKVFEQHKYQGHIPISAIYAFLGILTAVLYRYSYFIVGNEYSSNFGNIKYRGLTINHQWSKSFEFEKLFQDYVSNFISPDVFYFSLLRPFYEIRIAKMFSGFRKFFPYFSSCNKNFKIKHSKDNTSIYQFARISKLRLWCGQCPKCVFVFTLLSAFLTKKDLIDIFKKNLYQDKDLLPLFKDVLGFGKMKPFDCVGTFEEAQSALYLSRNKFKNDFIVKQLGDRVRYDKNVLRAQKESNVPEQFRFLGMESVLILGYGREGQITKKYLEKYYPKIKIGVADEKLDKNYLKRQNENEFDIAIKTPGISKDLVTIPYTTATNIFFSKVVGNPSTSFRARNLIIGITGSKGKSTTSSLIFEILKTAGKNVKLLGNIGNPMLNSLLNPIKKGAIFVLELSSY